MQFSNLNLTLVVLSRPDILQTRRHFQQALAVVILLPHISFQDLSTSHLDRTGRRRRNWYHLHRRNNMAMSPATLFLGPED